MPFPTWIYDKYEYFVRHCPKWSPTWVEFIEMLILRCARKNKNYHEWHYRTCEYFCKLVTQFAPDMNVIIENVDIAWDTWQTESVPCSWTLKTNNIAAGIVSNMKCGTDGLLATVDILIEMRQTWHRCKMTLNRVGNMFGKCKRKPLHAVTFGVVTTNKQKH